MNMHVLLYACNNTIYIYLITFRYLIRNPKCLEHVSQVWITVHNKISKLSIITIYHFSNLFEIPINFEIMHDERINDFTNIFNYQIN